MSTTGVEQGATEDVQFDADHPRASFSKLTLGAIGIVYGDIGTSPLYAVRESVRAAVGPGHPAGYEAVLGILSLIIWALILVVTLKYVVVLLRADNNGEGGTLALMALANRAMSGRVPIIILLGIISGGLFYGDAIITPSLSVLSAIEGIKTITPTFEPYVVPITAAILLALFSVQSYGTARVASFFGPITLIWFIALALAGIWHISQMPAVLFAFNPLYGVSFLLHHGLIGLFTLGAVFLVVTGSEALYADLGHFGRGPIRTAWLFVALPALTINYLGQGALVLGDPATIENPFFFLYPDWALIPMVVLATAATVIASQAVITGAYSVTQQAIQLGLLPRLEIRHTSEALVGQIFMPRVNGLLLVGVLFLVFLFRSSDALASAYGIAVTGTMVVTTMLAFIVIRKVWNWSPLAAGLLVAPFLALDLTFLGANLLKVVEGGWVPLLLGSAMVTVMYTWRRGTAVLAAKTIKLQTPLRELIEMLERSPPHRAPGTAVFLTGDTRLRTDGASAQSQAQQGAARAQCRLDGPIRRDAACLGEGARAHRAFGRELSACHSPLRVHGCAKHSAGARDRTQAGMADRHHVNFVLSVSALSQARRPIGNAALAGQAIHDPRLRCERCDRIFQDSHRSRGRDRRTGSNLTAMQFAATVLRSACAPFSLFRSEGK